MAIGELKTFRAHRRADRSRTPLTNEDAPDVEGSSRLLENRQNKHHFVGLSRRPLVSFL
jgi:hypothetical protein